MGDSLTGVARFGPDTGSLQVHTYREGVAAKVGHDLIIEVTEWSGSDEGGTLELTANPRSLVVREGNRGVKPLTDKDRASIQKTIQGDILGSAGDRVPLHAASTAATSRATSRSPARRSRSSSTSSATATASARRSRSSRRAGASSPTAASWAR